MNGRLSVKYGQRLTRVRGADGAVGHEVESRETMSMTIEEQYAADESLSALVDGELPTREAAHVHGRLAHEPELARRFVAIEGASVTLIDAYRDLADVLERMFQVFSRMYIDARRHDPRPAAGEAPFTSGPGEAAPRDIDWAVAGLPSEQRRALCLVTVEGMSYREAAEALDVTAGTVRTRVARARAALVERLERAQAPARRDVGECRDAPRVRH